MKNYPLLLLAAGCWLWSGCSAPVPEEARPAAESAPIYPDYAGCTVPVNIAPLDFQIQTPGDRFVSHLHARGKQGFTVSGPVAEIPPRKWKNLLAEAAGDSLYVDIYVRSDGRWRRYPPVVCAVAEPIDPYITYRLIEPSYVSYEEMELYQRNLETFEERMIFGNETLTTDTKGQCINCHAAQDYNRSHRSQFHVRANCGGTLLIEGKQARKIDLKQPATISAGVYPAWHPTLPLIVYSNNTTDQNFHIADRNKIEVQDAASDLILYDTEQNRIEWVAHEASELETFPAWNHDGTALYYVSAALPPDLPAEQVPEYKMTHYRDIRYDLYRRPFDPESRRFGPADTLLRASAVGRSVTFPRESPDGRWLLVTQSAYGTFPIWHHDADLYLLDLASGAFRPLAEVNSDETESYHCWSSNGRWILFSSRRDDGSYTRLYIAHFDTNGRAGKPFLLPQRIPEHNRMRFKSYNVPEFMAEPLSVSRATLLKAVRGEAAATKMR